MQTTATIPKAIEQLNADATITSTYGLLILHPTTGASAVIDTVETHDGRISAVFAELDGISDDWGIGTIKLQLDQENTSGWVFASTDDGAPICPTCKVNECADASEPGYQGFVSQCSHCMGLSGVRPVGGEFHCHTQAKLECESNWVGTTKPPPDHTWQTAVSLRPTFVGGVHTGFRCNAHEPCGWTTTALS